MLKTDYKDAMYDGQRRYRMIQNEDGTCSLPDATIYTQEGDRFGANDINTTNLEVNKLQRTAVVNLPAADWSAAAPYKQRVAVPGIKAVDEPQIHTFTPKELTAATVKLRRKMAAMITDGETEDGFLTVYCGEKKPTADFPILVKGVSVNG